jgi:hypothetical protein
MNARPDKSPAWFRCAMRRFSAAIWVGFLSFFLVGRVSASSLLVAAVFIGLLLIAIVLIVELRKTPGQEAEMIEREDKEISKTRDDPNEPARWVP